MGASDTVHPWNAPSYTSLWYFPPHAASARSNLAIASVVMLRSLVACPKYSCALIRGSTRCGLVGSSVYKPPPWNDATAATLLGIAAAVRIANAPVKQ